MDGGAVIKLHELEVSIAMRNNKLRSFILLSVDKP
jgi:hypothetical protein